MDTLLLAFSVVLPLVIYMSIGGIIKKFGIFSYSQFRSLNVVIFKIFIPLALFFDVYESNLGESIQPDVFIFAVAGILAVYGVTWLLIGKTVKDQADGSTMIQGIYRSNYVLFGKSIAVSLCSDAGVGLVAALAAVVVPLFNMLSVILFETRQGVNVAVKKILINILKNPLVDAGVLGIVFAVLHIEIPQMIAIPLMNLGDIATPLALVTLGGMLSFGSMINHRKQLVITVISRLLLVPLVMLTSAIFLGYRGEVLIAILAIFASPTAVASVAMAQTQGGNVDLAGEIVAATSVCCIITIFLFVVGLYSLGWV